MRSVMLFACLVFAACGPSPLRNGPGASLGATPTQVSASQPTTLLKLLTWDENGDPGTGSAHFSSVHGALLESPDVELTGGAATITFRCLPGADQGCQGSVEVDADWRSVTAPVLVQVGTP